MKKLIFTIAAIAALPAFNFAQYFEFEQNNVVVYTEGDDETFITAYNAIHNLTNDPFIFEWRMVNPEVELPEGWAYNGFCDNTLCYTPESIPNPFSGATIESMEVEGRDQSPFKLQLDIATSAANGSVVFEFEAKVDDQVDTAYFYVEKTPMGISHSFLKENHLHVYPNPALDLISIKTNREAGVEALRVVDIAGKELMRISINAEYTTLDISQFAAGQYILIAINSEGQTLGLRRLIKQ